MALYSLLGRRDPTEALGFDELHIVTFGLDLSKPFEKVIASTPEKRLIILIEQGEPLFHGHQKLEKPIGSKCS